MNGKPTNQIEVFWGLEDAKFMWDEYKYRHEHIWKLIFQITTAVIAVSIVPYISGDSIVKTLKWFISVLPFIGAGIIVFGWSRLSKEICAMDELKKRHRAFQKVKYHIDHYAKEEKNEALEDIMKRKSSFSHHVELYLGLLFVLSVLNIFVIIFVWLPEVSKSIPVVK